MTGFPRPAFDYSELFYNGFKFPPALHSTITSEPVYDDSERQVLYVKHVVNVEFIIHDGVDAQYAEAGIYSPVFPVNDFQTRQGVLSDASLKVLREKLTTPGGHLVVNNTGFGGLRTNPVNGTIMDVRFGPKPRLLNWENIAGGRAIKVTWECEVAISEQGCSTFSGVYLLCHSATQTWDISEGGMTTRRTTGYMIIRANRLATPTRVRSKTNSLTTETQDSGTQLATSKAAQLNYSNQADQLRSIINFPPLPGFQRKQDFRLSPDKTRLDYTLIDKEIESQNAYYPGTISIEASQRTQTNSLFEGIEWLSTIEGTIRLPKNQPMSLAWIAFSKLVAKRRRLLRENAAVPSTDTKGKWSTIPRPSGVPPLIVATNFSFTENLFKPEFSFSVTYQFQCYRTFIYKAAGVGRRAYSVSETWKKWQESMGGIPGAVDGVHGLRGLRGLVYDKRTDLLIGLCDAGLSPNDAYQNQDDELKEDEKGQEGDDLMDYSKGKDEINEKSSWLRYRSQVDIIEDTQRLSHYKLEPNEWSSSSNLYPNSGRNSPDDYGRQLRYTMGRRRGSTTLPIIQARNSTKHMIAISGVAERIRYDIAQPIAIGYGGVYCFPVGKLHLRKSIRSDPISGERIVKAMWYQVYQLSGKPAAEWSALVNESTWA